MTPPPAPPPPSSARFALGAAGILGLTGVGLGAVGAHALRADLMARGMLVSWETAARYHLLHALALAALAAWARADGRPDRRVPWIAGCWCAGVLLFSGSLYLLATGGPRWLGPVSPLGGMALMAGWLLTAAIALRPARAE